MSPRNRIIILFAIVAVLLGSAVFFSAKKSAPPVSQKPTVAVTVYPLYDIASNIAGDQVSVTLLLPAGANPHTFEPTPTAVRAAQGAAAVYAIGHGLDDWVDILRSDKDGRKIIVDRNIVLRQSAEEEGDDPHYWLTIPNAKKIAATIAEDLTARFPEHAQSFQANFNRYLGELDAADNQMRSLFGELGSKNLVTLHDAWYYFAEEYGLNIVGTFEPTAGREPTPQYLAALSAAVSKAEARVLYTEPLLPTTTLESFLRDKKMRAVELDPAEGARPESYIEIMLYNARTIRENQ